MLGGAAILGWGLVHPLGDDAWSVAAAARAVGTPTRLMPGPRGGTVVMSPIEQRHPAAGAERATSIAAAALSRAVASVPGAAAKPLPLFLAADPREDACGVGEVPMGSARRVDAIAASARLSLDPDASRVFEGEEGAGVAALVAAKHHLTLGAGHVAVGGVRVLGGTELAARLAASGATGPGGAWWGARPAEAAAFLILGAGSSPARLIDVALEANASGAESARPASDEDAAAACLRRVLESLGIDERAWIPTGVGGAPHHARILQRALAPAPPLARTLRLDPWEDAVGDLGPAAAAVYATLACARAEHGCAEAREALVVLPSLRPVGALRLAFDDVVPPEPPVRVEPPVASSARVARDVLRDAARVATGQRRDELARALSRAEPALAAIEAGLRGDDELLGLLDEGILGVEAVVAAATRDAADEALDEEVRAAASRLTTSAQDALAALAGARPIVVEILAAPRTPPAAPASARAFARPGWPPLDPSPLPTHTAAPLGSRPSSRSGARALLSRLLQEIQLHRVARSDEGISDADCDRQADSLAAATLDAVLALRASEASRRGGAAWLAVLDELVPVGSPLPDPTYARGLVLACTIGAEAARHAVETLVAARGSARRACVDALIRGTSPDLDRAVEGLLERGDAPLAIAALEVLAERRAVRVGRVAPHLRRRPASLRVALVRALGTAAHREAAALALASLAVRDDDAGVRAAALTGLARLGDRDAVPRARQLVQEGDASPALLDLLAVAGGPGDLAWLAADTRPAGIARLGWLGAVEGLELLCGVLDEEARAAPAGGPTPRARAAAAALHRITGAPPETHADAWRQYLARDDVRIPRAPRVRSGAAWDRTAAAAAIVLAPRGSDRRRAEEEAAIAFGCAGAIPSPRGWLVAAREALARMGVPLGRSP